MDEACYEKCAEFIREGHQVLIFVHSRGATFQLAKFLLERAAISNETEAFLPPNTTTALYHNALKKVSKPLKLI
jgi:replicative superfamily II helicase